LSGFAPKHCGAPRPRVKHGSGTRKADGEPAAAIRETRGCPQQGQYPSRRHIFDHLGEIDLCKLANALAKMATEA
jgi:hypothetical protein